MNYKSLTFDDITQFVFPKNKIKIHDVDFDSINHYSMHNFTKFSNRIVSRFTFMGTVK
jgi:hypothetical protein